MTEKRPVVDLGLLMAMNPEFAEMYRRGDKWATDYVSKAQRLNDGDIYAFKRNFDGKPHNWCGNCPDPEGCIMCALPPPRTRHEVVGKFKQTSHPPDERKEEP